VPPTPAARARSPIARAPPAVVLADVQRAARLLKGKVRRTPIVEAPPWPGAPGAQVYLKLESLQEIGSFKIRGATNRLAQLTKQQATRGVVAASAGNHAQGVAFAARSLGVPATIVMPAGASPAKVVATEALGARVLLHGTDLEEARQEAVRLGSTEGLTFIPPYDDRFVIAGQGTVGLEVLEDLPDVRTIVVGVGGGGLLAGIAVAVKALKPHVRLVAVQPAGAGSLRASLRAGRVISRGPPETFADGLATRHVGEMTFDILSRTVDEAIEVDEREIARAVFFLLEQSHLLAEGGGAAPVAALLAHPELTQAGPTVAVVSGGNLDPFVLDRVLWSGLAHGGRVLRFRTAVPDRPGELVKLLSASAQAQANVYWVRHDRESPTLLPGQVAIEVELEVRNAEHAEKVLADLKKGGWTCQRLVPTVDGLRG
jgi:threonine dehydratase